jgi:hypothetical protein
MSFDTGFAKLVNDSWANQNAVNSRDDYSHGEWKLADNLMNAALVLFCKGDQELARGLSQLMYSDGAQGVGYFSRVVPEDEIRQYA